MHKLVNLSIAFLILSGVFSLLEWLFAANKEQKRLRRGMGTDLVYWFSTPFLARYVSLAGTVIILALLYHTKAKMLKALFATRETLITSHLPHWAQVILMLLTADIISYWLHRWFHTRAMWKFHAVHHSSEDLDWLSAVRLHPVNEWLTRWIQTSLLVLMGFSPGTVAVYIPFLTFFAIMLHANLTWGFGWLGNIIASPRFHRWHHTSQLEGLDKNFAGMFPFIDRLLGTYYMPEDRLPEKFGLHNEKIPGSFWGQMLYPFRRQNELPSR